MRNNKGTLRKAITLTILLIVFLGACNQIGNQALDNRNIDDNYLRSLQTRGTHEPLAEPQGQLSSESTSVPSDQFPHTKAVQVQHAKYEFVVLPQGARQVTPEEIARLLPEGTRLTPEEIARLIPEGAQLSPEAIAARLRGRMGAEQPAAPAPQQPQQQPQEPREQPKADTTAAGVSEIEAKVIELTNAERRNNGLSELSADTGLSKVAQEKSNDMQANNYFSHTSPTYGSPFDMMRDFGVSYNAAAENIAQGQQSAEQVVQAWMNSEGHRANILNGTFTHIGVGYNENGHYWTQMFISK